MNRTSFSRDERGCPVVPRACARERLTKLETALSQRVPGVGFARPVEVRDWSGDAQQGFFVRIDAATFALHVGRGTYVTLDVERDLNGVVPSEARRLVLQRSGNVREPDPQRSFNRH